MRPALAGALLCSLGCTSFPVIEPGECGNVVLEGNEACDTIVDASFACRPPGDVDECQYDCRPKPDGMQQFCPPGYGCAQDGVCRFDQGTYQDEPVTITSEATGWLATTNFDGDGRLDLISAEPPNLAQQARFRLHYFDVDGKLLETRPFPSVTSHPISRDMNGDGNYDLLFSTYRVGLVPGTDDRQWLPASFSSYRIPNAGMRVLNVRRDLVGLGTPLAALTKRGDINGVFVPKFDSARLAPTLDLPLLVEDLVGSPIAANVVEGPQSPCDELVLGYRNTDHLRVIDLCEVQSDPDKPEVMWREAPLQQLVQLPPGIIVDSGALAADVNGDGHLDVIVRGKSAQEQQNFVALGDGQQLEALAHPLTFQLAPSLTDYDELDLDQMPLAAGDLSGDGIADFVFPKAVLSSRPSLVNGDTTYALSYENRADPWTMAALGDLNANGSLDVVAATGDVTGITVVSGSSAFQYVGVGLPTQGPVQFITTGDFDGDLVADVGYVEKGKPTERGEFLAVAFGRALGTPSAGRRIAAVTGVQQLGHGIDSGFDALFMVTDERIGGERVGALTLFEGNSERLPLAPYALVTFAIDDKLDNALALALMAGSFVEPGSNDLFAIGEQRNPLDKDERFFTQWVVPNLAGAADLPFRLDVKWPLEATPLIDQDTTERLAISGAAFDVDHDGIDEALWLVPEADGGCVLLVYGVRVDARRDRGSAELRDSIHFAESCREPELRVLGLDDDGAPALAALVGEPAKLRILWDDGSGRLSLDQSFTVPTPETEDVRAFALSPDGRRLAVVTPESLYVVDESHGSATAGASSSAASHPSWEDVKPVPRVVLSNARGVAMIDPNLDGVPAIAVADDEGIRLFEAKLK